MQRQHRAVPDDWLCIHLRQPANDHPNLRINAGCDTVMLAFPVSQFRCQWEVRMGGRMCPDTSLEMLRDAQVPWWVNCVTPPGHFCIYGLLSSREGGMQ